MRSLRLTVGNKIIQLEVSSKLLGVQITGTKDFKLIHWGCNQNMEQISKQHLSGLINKPSKERDKSVLQNFTNLNYSIYFKNFNHYLADTKSTPC